MKTFKVRNVHEALERGIDSIRAIGIKQESRNGDTLEFPEPVTTTYLNPTERVLFQEERDANPFFHLMESLWMLAGRNDVRFVTQYVKTMSDFSDDGTTFNGAYGYRWRHHFNIDQLPIIIRRLKENPEDRRCVLAMWDGFHDLDLDTKDQPCNTSIYFKIRDGKLNMTVCNRSNDMIWGAYGANAVHFSVLQEYMASMIGVDVGVYNQVSDSLHVYMNSVWDKVKEMDRSMINPYDQGDTTPYPIVKDPVTWDSELYTFMFMAEDSYTPDMGHRWMNPFFPEVAIPVDFAYKLYKAGKIQKALDELNKCKAEDWRIACTMWIMRRVDKKLWIKMETLPKTKGASLMEPRKGDVFLKYGGTIGNDSPLTGMEHKGEVCILVHPMMLDKFEEYKKDD